MKQIRIRLRLAFRMARYSATALILICTVVAGLVMWNVYVTSPWTRDGQVRMQVVRVAPRVPGEITSMEVKDNQVGRKATCFTSLTHLATPSPQPRRRTPADLAGLLFGRSVAARAEK